MRDYHAHFENGNYYHIYNRGNNGERIFLNDGNYGYFLSKWAKYIDPYFETFAYCLMPNHFHFLIKVGPEDRFTKIQRISKAQDEAPDINIFMENQFKKLLSSYSLAFNKQQNRHGSLFEKRFKRILIDSDSYLSKLIHYIHNNPLHHGFAINYITWKFCSYRSIVSDQPTRVNRNEILKWFGNKQAFIDFHNTNIDYRDIKDVALDLE